MAILADTAQFLRGGGAFGGVAFHDGDALTPDHVHVEPGYADCLPIRGGGVWREPDLGLHMETKQ